MGVMTDRTSSPDPQTRIQWFADAGSRQILAAYGRRRERPRDVMRRALRMLAMADGILAPDGSVRSGQRRGRP